MLAHLAVVRHVEGVLVAHGVATGPAVTAALALVERHGRDGDVDVDALKAAASAASDETRDGRLAVDPSRRAAMWLATAAGNVCWLARKERGWKDAPRTILDAAAAALSSLRVPGLDRREDLVQRALAAEAEVPPAPVRTKLPGPPRLKKVGETPELGELASAWWQRQRPRRDPRRQTDAATLAVLLRARALPVTDAVLSFEARYGGICFCEPGGLEGADVVLGPSALLADDTATPGRERGLVPVALSPNDVWYLLDAQGTMWVWDTIEQPEATLFARASSVGLARLLLFCRAFHERGALGGLDLDGRRGDALAASLGLSPIAEASDDLARFWGDRNTLVIEHNLGAARAPITAVIGRAAARLPPGPGDEGAVPSSVGRNRDAAST